MSIVTELRKSLTEATPVMAVLGATDLAVARVRAVAVDLPGEAVHRVQSLQAGVEKATTAVEGVSLQKAVKQLPQLPALATEAAHEVRGRLEHGYESLAERGKTLFEHVGANPASQTVIRQSKATVSRSKAAMTTVKSEAAEVVEAGKITKTAKTTKDKATVTARTTRSALRATAATTGRGTPATTANRAAGTTPAAGATPATVTTLPANTTLPAGTAKVSEGE